MNPMKTIEIDGSRFDDLDGFFEEFGARAIPGMPWGRNLDALNDVLGGGFGTPDDGFALIWRNSNLSRRRLGHGAMARRLEERGSRYRSVRTEQELEAARTGKGPTLFDAVVELVRSHPVRHEPM